jgi:HEAT repeat protein
MGGPKPSFQTISSKRPWYKKPASLVALAFFAALAALAAFAFKGDEATIALQAKSGKAWSVPAAYVLGLRGIEKDSTRDILLELLANANGTSSEGLRRACAYSLGSLRSHDVALRLLDALRQDPANDVRCAAARALGKVGDPDAADPLVAALDEHESSLRAAAADGCGALKDKRAIDPLIQKLTDIVPEVRRSAHGALQAITGQDIDLEAASWRKWREKNP